MSRLIFDGSAHVIVLIADDGATVGRWTAFNNVDSHATLTHLPNAVYMVQDRTAPRHHVASANGPYGLYGIVRFNVVGHAGVGIHSGRAAARHAPGPAHATMGCIRTTDEAMQMISSFMLTSPLTTVEVKNNSAAVARSASRRGRHRQMHTHGHGHHYG